MRLLIYFLILLLLFYAPVQRLDVAKLEPVEVIFIKTQEDSMVIQTDTNAWGRGVNLEAALEDLHQRTPGVIYLDTAQFLITSRSAASQMDALRPHLQGSVKLCMAEEVDMDDIAKFLEIHGELPTLKQWKKGEEMPMIQDGKIIE